MCPSLIEIGSKTAEKNSAQTKQANGQTNRHYENNGQLAVNQYCCQLNVINGAFIRDGGLYRASERSEAAGFAVGMSLSLVKT